MDAVAQRGRDRRPGRERLRPQEHGLPAGQLAQRAERRAGDRERARVELDHDEPALARRCEQRRVDSRRDETEVAGEALRRRRRGLLGGRQERVDPREQLLAQRSPRREAEPLGREERRDARAPASRAGRGTRCSGRPGSKPCTTSKRPCSSASWRLARTPTGTPRLDRRETGTAAPIAIRSARSPRASARCPATRSAFRLEGASTVTVWPSARSCLGDPGDVLVHVVRLRPRKRGHEADPHAGLTRIESS